MGWNWRVWEHDKTLGRLGTLFSNDKRGDRYKDVSKYFHTMNFFVVYFGFLPMFVRNSSQSAFSFIPNLLHPFSISFNPTSYFPQFLISKCCFFFV